MQVFVEKRFDFFFVVGEQCGGNFYLVAVFVVAFGCDAVYGCEVGWEVVVDDSEGAKIFGVDGFAAVVRFALVAL